MPRGYDLMIRVTYCVMVSSAGSLRRRPNPQALSFGVAVAHRMNLAPIRADGARRPIRVDDKLDRARKVSGVGKWFAKERFLANTLFITFALLNVIFIIIGTFFRGPNWSMVSPF